MLSKAKDPIKPEQRRGVVYKIPCNSCPLVYTGQTGNNFATRLSEHRSALCLPPQQSSVAKNAILESHTIDWKFAKVIDNELFYFKRLILEAWHCNHFNSVNRCDLNVPRVYRFSMPNIILIIIITVIPV